MECGSEDDFDSVSVEGVQYARDLLQRDSLSPSFKRFRMVGLDELDRFRLSCMS